LGGFSPSIDRKSLKQLDYSVSTVILESLFDFGKDKREVNVDGRTVVVT